MLIFGQGLAGSQLIWLKFASASAQMCTWCIYQHRCAQHQHQHRYMHQHQQKTSVSATTKKHQQKNISISKDVYSLVHATYLTFQVADIWRYMPCIIIYLCKLFSLKFARISADKVRDQLHDIFAKLISQIEYSVFWIRVAWNMFIE